MDKVKLHLTDKNWSYGSYKRKDYKKPMIYTFHQYKDFSVLYNLSSGKTTVTDGIVEEMFRDGLITADKKEEYENRIYNMFTPMDKNDEPFIEELYEDVQRIRKDVVGHEVIEQEQERRIQRRCVFDLGGGIDQRKKKEDLLETCQSVIMILTQVELYYLMEEDIKVWLSEGKDVYVVVNGERGYDIPTVEEIIFWTRFLHETIQDEIIDFKEESEPGLYHDRIHYINMENVKLNLGNLYGSAELNHQIKNGKTCLFFYGTDGFLHCRNLSIPSVVHGIPTDYFTRSMTNQHGMIKAVIAYVPKGFDIKKWVSMVEKTRISYWQLARLWEDQGDIIYEMEPEQLYIQYPQYFLNIYANGAECLEANIDFPIRIEWKNRKDCMINRTMNVKEYISYEDIFAAYDHLRDKAIREYLNEFDNFEYHSAYFNENMKETKIPWNAKEQQNGILVQAVRVKKAGNSYVHFCKESENVRTLIGNQERMNQKKNGVLKPAIISNFLFFLTPKLAALYNDLRFNRPKECLPYEKGHLDYMLYELDRKRIETFPLFKKACIGLKKDGKFLFFNYEMGGGKIAFFHSSTLGKEDSMIEIVTWNKEDVNPLLNLSPTYMKMHATEYLMKQRMVENELENPKVLIYSPDFSKPDGEPDLTKYRILVGENRFNIVISQNQILSIRRGSVVLSPVGVVLSLNNKYGEQFRKNFGLRELEDGYFDCSNLDFTVNLDKPKEVSEEDWNQVIWAYGGGLSLIKDGKGLCDEGKMFSWMEKEGWMSPLSRQTQESSLHVMTKHPRTAIGITKEGDLVVLVYSGRTKMSAGADYDEMCRIARKIFPDIWSLMNVDGGGSAMLGLAVGNSFMELSYPATSFDSCAGMVRPINTLLWLQ